jgi:hypothetical protein
MEGDANAPATSSAGLRAAVQQAMGSDTSTLDSRQAGFAAYAVWRRKQHSNLPAVKVIDEFDRRLKVQLQVNAGNTLVQIDAQPALYSLDCCPAGRDIPLSLLFDGLNSLRASGTFGHKTL